MAESVLTGMVSAACFLAVGVGLFFAGRACENGRIARNNTIGIRTKHTLASDAAWKAGHIAGGRTIKIAGLGACAGSALAVLSGLLTVLGASENATNSTIAALIIASALWSVVWVLLAAGAANNAARELTR